MNSKSKFKDYVDVNYKSLNQIWLILILATFLLLGISITSLNASSDLSFIDLNNWSSTDGNGNWQVQAGGRTVQQSINGNPTFFLSDTDYIDVIITGTLKTDDTDDDWIGFVLGFQNNAGLYDFVLYDWRKGSVDSFAHKLGVIKNLNDLRRSSIFWNHQEDSNYDIIGQNNPGWQQSVEYQFEILYTADRIKIKIDGTEIFNVSAAQNAPFEAGKLGFYNYSQAQSTYGNVQLVSVDPNANAPVAGADQYGVSKNTTLTVNSANGLLFNDYDPNLDNFVIQNFTQPSHGTLSLVTGTGAFTYTPNNNYIGPDSFTYNLVETGTNDLLTSETVTVSLNVIDGTNVAPSNIEIDLIETFSTFENGVQLATVTAIDSNAGDFHDYLLIDNNNGRFGINGNRVLLADKSSIVYGNSYNIVVRAVDFGNLSVDRTLSIKMPYSITYNLAGGINDISNPAVFTASTAAITLITPSRFGFTFDGWYDQVSGGSIITEIPTGTQTNQAIYAQWTPADFYINYDLGGGNNSISNPGIYNILDLPLFISPPTKAGFVFNGWQIFLNNDSILTPSGLISIKASQSSIEASIHNYQLNLGNSSWTGARDHCSNLGGYLATVTSALEWQYILQKILQNSNPNDRFWLGARALNSDPNANAVNQNWQWLNNEGAVPLAGDSGFHNWALNEPNNFGASGEFYLTTWGNQTWNDLPNDPGNMHGFVCEFDEVIYLDASITLTAVYLPNSYQVSFNSNGGSSVSSLQFETEQVLNLPTPTRNAFVFDGWYIDSNLTHLFEDQVMPPRNVILYAKWSEVPYSITYHNLFDGFNDQNNPIQFTFSSSNLTIHSATRVGFTFIDWFDNSDLTGTAVRVIPSGTSQNFTLYAKWQINAYTISFDSNGGSTVSDLTADYQSGIELPNPTRLGYRFDGWTENGTPVGFTTMPLGNRALKATWSSLSYTLTLVNSITNETTLLTADFEAPINLPIMEQAGYTFEGWLENNRPVRYSQMPEGNRTLIGVFKARNYTLNFSSEMGNPPLPIEGPYQSMILLPEMSVPHHHFKGWEGPDGLLQGAVEMPLNGATLKAVFEPKLYSLQLMDNGTLHSSITAPYQSTVELPILRKSGYQFIGWTLDGLFIKEITITDEPMEIISVYEPKRVTITIKTPQQSFQTLLTTDQPLTSLPPLNVPERYVWIGYFTLPFGNGENLMPGQMIKNADTTLVFPYYLRADQTFDTSTERLSANPHYVGLSDPTIDEITVIPWGSMITFIITSMALIVLYVASKGGKWDETV